MGEYSYSFYVRYRNPQLCETSFTADCHGSHARDELMELFKSFPNVLMVRVSRLEPDGHWHPESPS